MQMTEFMLQKDRAYFQRLIPCLPNLEDMDWVQVYWEIKPQHKVWEGTLIIRHGVNTKVRVDFDVPLEKDWEDLNPEDVRLHYFGDIMGYLDSYVNWKRL